MSENRFRIELGGEVLVSDGSTYWQYSKSSAQVVINNLSELDQSVLPSRILSTYLTQYTYKEKSRTGKETELEWRADSGAQTNYTAIDIRAVTKTGEVLTLQLTDRNNNIQTYTFKKSTFGAKIPKAVFTFEVPENVQILDNRK
jgi:outer membrane lipoprotein-sorting protein